MALRGSLSGGGLRAALAETGNTSGRMSRGVTKYNDLEGLPSINSVELRGNKTGDELGLVNADEYEEQVGEIITELEGKIDDAYVEDGYLYLTGNNEIIAGPLGPFSGGGGGGGGNNAVLSVLNTTGWLSKTISLGSGCQLSYTWASTEDDIPTGDGIMTISVAGVIKKTQNISQGSVTVDVGDYLAAGTNKVKVSVSDVYENSRTITFTITAVDLSMSSNFDNSGTFAAEDPIEYTYTPVGAAEKTVYFYIDGELDGTATVTASGRQQSYTISGLPHGAHTLRVYFTAVIDEETVSSNTLFYGLIVVDPESSVPVIASDFRATTAVQYETIGIRYRVYTPNSLTSPVTLLAGGAQVASVTVDRTEQTWSYRPDSTGSLTLTITSGTASKSFTLTVSESSIDVEAETEALALYLDSYGRSNNEANPGTWIDADNNISATLTGFNYVSDGWVNDEDGITVLRVSGDARVTIPYKPFAADFRSTGKTIEIEFATRNILDYDATAISCMSGGRGFRLTAQKASLASEQSEISTQYKEDEHVRISFVAEKRAENRLLYIYINGIMSGAVRYPADDDFSQVSPVNISIGSNSVTTDIYCIRIYDNNLTRYQLLDNWIADTRDITLMLDRYNRNNVYDEYGAITIGNLPEGLPYMVISCAELPQYKGDKKTVSGYYVDPADSSKSFSFAGAQADVQGTSSQYYPRKNYKIKFNGGFAMTATGETQSTYRIRSTSIPTKTFCFKADVASSEGANNVELARLYNDACPYKTPAQVADSGIRQGIDGFPIVIFWDSGSSVSFVGKYNFNNDKGTEEVFGFASGDESWEILNNSSSRVLWKSADFSGSGWLSDFEARYPDTDPAYTDSTQLAAFAAWAASTDTTAATGDDLDETVTYDGTPYTKDTAAYRLAKFKAEAGDYMEMQSALFYYLFTELFLMVDSRAKNAFPSFIGSEVSA